MLLATAVISLSLALSPKLAPIIPVEGPGLTAAPLYPP